MEYVIWIISFLMFSTGLFFTARYMDKGYAALSFVPIANFYVMVSLAWYWTVLFSVICGLLVMWIAVTSIGLFILYLIQAYLLYQVWMRTSGKSFLAILAAILPPIGMLWIWIELMNKWKNQDLQKKVQIKLITCPNCKSKQQVRLSRPKHTCTECAKVLVFKKPAENKKSL